MSTLHHPAGGFPTDPQSEKHELQDIGAADLSPTLGSAITWDDVDRMWRGGRRHSGRTGPPAWWPKPEITSHRR